MDSDKNFNLLGENEPEIWEMYKKAVAFFGQEKKLTLKRMQMTGTN